MLMSVKDEKISSEKVDLSMKIMITSDQRICDLSITSIYWNVFMLRSCLEINQSACMTKMFDL